MIQEKEGDKKFKNHKWIYDCPLKLVLDTIGGKWKLLILAYLLRYKTVRFSAFKNYLSWITDKMLISSLRDLEVDGLVVRKVYSVVPPKVEYSLSEHGEKFSPLVEEMQKLGMLYSIVEWGAF